MAIILCSNKTPPNGRVGVLFDIFLFCDKILESHYLPWSVFENALDCRMEILMKQQRHRRKESFSLLLVSNTGKESRYFYVSIVTLRLLIVLMLLICASLAWIMFRSGTHYKTESDLRRKLVSSEQLVKQLESEKETLNAQNTALAAENEALKQVELADAETQGIEVEGTQKDTSIPSHYPYTGVGILKEQYSEEHPYFSISTQLEDRIVAAGDGTVASIDSDDTYPLIIVVEHGNGYKTRYMCQKEAQVQVSVGEQVQIRDTLIVIDREETQMDYQVIYDDQAIDPLLVLEAKG